MTQPKLLLLPGTQCNELLWQDFLPNITPAFDYQHWPIPTLSFDKTLAQLHQDVMALITEGSGRGIVFGFSLGGYIVARYLAEYGEALNQWLVEYPTGVRPAFVICSHTPTALPSKELEQRRRILSILEKNDYAGVTPERVCQLLGKKQHNNIDIISTVQTMDRLLGKENLIHQLSFTGARVDSLESLNEVSQHFEIELVCTQADPLVNYEWLQRLEGKVNCSLVGDEGHMLPLEYPNLLGVWLKNRFG